MHGTVGPTADVVKSVVAEGDFAPGLLLHGNDDPFVSGLQLFLEEFSALTDVDVISFARTTHGFSRPDKVPGDEKMRFSPEVAQRAWRSIERMLADAFCGGPSR